MRSIRNQLLLGLLCATPACTGGAGVHLYKALQHETSELADLQLRQLAAALPNEFAPGGGVKGKEPEEEFILQAWDGSHAPVYTSQDQGLLPRYLVRGFVVLNWNGARWRVYGETRAHRYVQVAQPMGARDRLAAKIAWRTGWPLIAFAGALAVLIAVIVGRALRPLDRLAAAVSGRSPHMSDPLPMSGMPPELAPVVIALNTLLQQFDAALSAQRRFVADAAHELRSPLTALKLQLQLLERADDESARRLAAGRLHERLDRSTHLVKQLLSLARHEAPSALAHWRPVDLFDLLHTAISDHGTFADSRDIDLGIEPAAQGDETQPGCFSRLIVRADPDGLQVLLNNLVDNALRYTQQGARVDLVAGMVRGRACLQVRDNGPGVPPLHRDRLFDRFYRPAGMKTWGSGLGLSIVRNIAEQHHAELSLAAGDDERGFCVTLIFPAEASTKTSSHAAILPDAVRSTAPSA